MELMIFKGDDARLRVMVKDQTGEGVTISGWSFTLTVATQIGESPEFTAAGSIENYLTGTVLFYLSSIQTNRTGRFLYDVRGIDTEGKKYTLDVGTITFIPHVTT